MLYLIVAFALIGFLSYEKLGQSEDPPFTFKVMVVKTLWPGATAHEVEQQVTDRIERKLQEVPNVDWVRSYSKPGESLVFFAIKDSAPAAVVPDTWYQVRKKIGDIRNTLPAGIQGPFFNDEFGDVYTNIYALTGDGFGYRELKEFGDRVRAELLRVPGVAKVDFIGEQDEKIFIEMSNAKLATLGVEPTQIIQTLAAQNVVAAAGVFDTGSDRIYVRPTGAFDSVEAIRDIAIRANNRVFRLGDIATVTRGYVDPPQQKMRWQGKEALGLGVTMVKGGDVIELGHGLDADGRAPAAAAAGRRGAGAGREHAARGAALDQRVHPLADRGGAHRARRVAGQPGVAHRAGRGDLDPARARGHVPVHVAVRHRPAQDLARRADPVAGTAGRRRDHRRRDDGDQAGAGLRPLPGGGLRVHEHRVPDADRDAGDGRRLPADRHGEERNRRIHALDLPGVGDRADRVVGDRRGRDPFPRLQDAAGLRARRADRRWAARLVARLARPPGARRPRRRITATRTPSIARRSTRGCGRSSRGAWRAATR